MLRRRNNLINARGINNNPLINCGSPATQDDFINFITDLLPIQQGVNQNHRKLPQNPPFEMHPYLQYVSEEYFEKYIIGTFPPISYVIDLLLSNHGLAITHLLQPNGTIYTTHPEIPFFHGNQGLQWDFALTQNELNTLNALPTREQQREYLIKWLIDNKIIYSDIIKSTQRSLTNGNYNAGDANLNNICVNTDLICHILRNPNAKYLMFNTSSTFGRNNWVNNQYSKSFDLFVSGCREIGLKVEFRINEGPTPHFNWVEVNPANAAFININLKNKVAFEVKLTITDITDKAFLLNCLNNESFSTKQLLVITPFSPAAVDRGMTRRNRVFRRWVDIHNAGVIDINSTRNFLKDIFKWFKQNEFDEIYNLNVNNF